MALNQLLFKRDPQFFTNFHKLSTKILLSSLETNGISFASGNVSLGFKAPIVRRQNGTYLITAVLSYYNIIEIPYYKHRYTGIELSIYCKNPTHNAFTINIIPVF